MLRETNVQRLHWADKTMSVLHQEQLEACDKRIAQLPQTTVFDLTDELATETVWQCSHDAQEHPQMQHLHTRGELRAQVLANLASEAALLSVEEHLLIERLITLGGTAELLDWEEMQAAESLVRRMWCTLIKKDGRVILRLAETLLAPLTLTISSHAHQDLREKLFRHDAVIRALLYMGGLLHYEEPLHHLMNDVLKDSYACDPNLAMRYLRVAYDYTYDRSGDMLLLHPGLADPEHLLACSQPATNMAIELNEDAMQGAMEGILPEEIPLFEMLFGLFQGATRPELTPEGAAEDLLLLAKQGVPLSEMQEVLGTLLTIQPTEEMRTAVAQVHQRTPRWGLMRTSLVQ